MFSFRSTWRYLKKYLMVGVLTVLVTVNSGYSQAQRFEEIVVSLKIPRLITRDIIVQYDGDDVYIDPAAADQIHVLTNSAGDRISNTTSGDSVCLIAADGTYWIVIPASTGTWADAN